MGIRRRVPTVLIDSNSINTVGAPVNTVGPSFDNVVPSLPVNTVGPSVSTVNAFQTPMDDSGIFDGAYDDGVGAEADLNNLETTMHVSPNPTTKIHKDHPLEQVIGDLNSVTLTRRMSKQNLEEIGLVTFINKQRRTNHKDYPNCLFACFLSQIKPKKATQALKDSSWVKAIQNELLQFKLLKF
ncbi:hypothetical protein Tco_0971054 [Tanacetum coccineum]